MIRRMLGRVWQWWAALNPLIVVLIACLALLWFLMLLLRKVAILQ